MIFERLKNGNGLLSSKHLLGTGSVANAGALFLERSEKNDVILSRLLGKERLNEPDLKDGCVVMLSNRGYRREDGLEHSGKGLFLLNSELNVIYQSQEAVLVPTQGTIDQVGVEDGRISLIDGSFYVWYCGYNGKNGRACVARSEDLLHWEKTTPLSGSINMFDNKDHVVIPERIGNYYYMLHRPWGRELFGESHSMPIRLGRSESLTGEWMDMGILMEPVKDSAHSDDWLGAGAPPFPLGNGRYLEIYHNAWYEMDGYRRYCASVAILDFEKGNPEQPKTLVTHRMENIFIPSSEYPNECNRELRLDIIFPMACYTKDKYLYLIYGAGDLVTCAARVPLQDLLEELESAPSESLFN